MFRRCRWKAKNRRPAVVALFAAGASVACVRPCVHGPAKGERREERGLDGGRGQGRKPARRALFIK